MSPLCGLVLRRGEFTRRSTFARPATSTAALCSVAPDSAIAFRRSELARDQVVATRSSLYDAALSSSRTSGFALLGDSLFSNARMAGPSKVSKNACPCIRVSLRSTSLIPSLLRGSPRKGHPWPFIGGTPSPLAASMPLAPLRSDSIRPSERGIRWRLVGRAMEKHKAASNQGELTSGCGRFVGRKTAKHFPPQSTQRLVPNFANENRWVSFALPTLRRALTTASLHALSDTTESPLSQGRAQQLVGWVQPIKLLRWASPILRFVDPSPVQPHSRSRPLPQGRVLLPQGGVLECQQPSAPSSLGTSQLLGTAQPTAKQHHPVGAVSTAKLLSSQQKHRSAGQNLKPNQTHPGTTHSPNRGQDHSHSVRHRYPSARPTTAAVHLFKKALQPCA